MVQTLYQQVFNSINSAIVVISNAGNILEVNSAYLDLFETNDLTQGDFLGKALLTHPLIVESDLSNKYIKLLNGQVKNIDQATLTRSDSKIETFLNIHSYSLENIHETGTAGIILVHENVSAIVKANRSENKARVLLDEIQEVAGLGVFDLDVPSQTSVWSKEYFRLLGYKKGKDASIPENFLARIHVEDREIVGKALDETFKEKKPFKVNFRLNLPNGDIRYVLERGRLITDDKGTPLRFLGTILDVSDQVEAEKRLKNSEQELSQILDNMQDTYYRTDTEGRITKASPSTEKLLGFKANEVLGMKITDFYIDPNARELLFKELKNNNGKVQGFEAPLEHKDGSVIWVSTNAQIILDENGKPGGIEGTTRNITDKKIAEEEIWQLNAKLEQRVKKRTQELLAANKELESFSYSVSHDLRAPLRHISGFSLFLLEEFSDKLDEEAIEYLNKIQNSSVHMSQLIKDLLNLANVIQTSINKTSIDLSKIANEIKNTLIYETSERDVTWIIEPDIIAFGDENLMRIVLTNLLNNAWKYTSKKKSAIIEFSKELENGKLTYVIKDNGVGFDMRYAEKLFGAFQRLHKKTEFEGTGIGLATVNRIIQRHQGKIWADAEVGKGATFRFTL